MIAEFYENSEIFITGGSGVVGKAAIEKLLRSCNVKKIFILLRCKKGVDPEDRLVDIKNSRIFHVLRESKPSELDKLVSISGNTALDGLGISPEDKERIKNCSIFIHSAATTRFDEPLKTAIRLNIKSTMEALKLAETMKNLKIFLHLSTYFSNPYLKYIEDKVYPAVFDWKIAIKMLDDDEIDPVLETITNKLINGFPNTYLFTKHLAEQLVNDYRFKLPVAIYKPSIVITALDEPEPGFTETMTGILGMLSIWGTGLLQAFYVKDLNMQMDMTPLDFGTKTLLMFAALKGQLPREKFAEAIPVGKFSSKLLLTQPFPIHCKSITAAVHKNPLEKSFWIPNPTVTSCIFYYWILVIFLQLLPALLMDGLLILFRKKTFMMQIQRKILVSRQALLFFLTNEYQSDGVTDFEEMVKIGHGTEFSLDSLLEYVGSDESMSKAMDHIVKGCRKFLLKEDDSSIEQCKRILKAKYIAYNILKGSAAYFIIRAIFRVAMSYSEQ